ncbi:MAG: WD40 repeat domain-containing protein [Anaerolineales bacterium]|nr:WD40 repeat domain-containing protein [Anaerolineales bacterium]
MSSLIEKIHNLNDERRIYLLRNLAVHFNEAQKTTRLRDFLSSFEVLQEKLAVQKCAELVREFDYLTQDDPLKLVQNALRMSQHVIDYDVHQLRSQLCGRLLENKENSPEISKLVMTAEQFSSIPALIPTSPTLGQAGGEIISIYRAHEADVRSIVITPDERFIISGAGDETVKIWDVHSGEELLILHGHTGAVNAVAITPNGQFIISGSEDKTVKIWDVHSGEELLTLYGHTGAVNAVAVTPDGQFIISGSEDKTVKIWNTLSGENLLDYSEHSSAVEAVIVTPDGQFVISGGGYDKIRVWNIQSGEVIAVFIDERGGGLCPHYVRALAVNQSGELIIVGVGEPGMRKSEGEQLVIWDIVSKKKTLSKVLDYNVDAVMFTPDDHFMIAGTTQGKIIIWDIESGEQVHTLKGHSREVYAICIFDNGRIIASGSNDGTIILWNLVTITQETNRAQIEASEDWHDWYIEKSLYHRMNI